VTDDAARREESLLDAIPRDIAQGLQGAADHREGGRQGQRSSRWAGSSAAGRTGFARIDGWAVAVLASDPMFYGGGWTADACQKVTRFLDLAETFHLPVVYLMDCPGFLIGLEAEKSATSARACGRWRRCSRPRCRGAPSSSATRSASRAWCISRPRG
jgi:hypothetical protein